MKNETPYGKTKYKKYLRGLPNFPPSSLMSSSMSSYSPSSMRSSALTTFNKDHRRSNSYTYKFIQRTLIGLSTSVKHRTLVGTSVGPPTPAPGRLKPPICKAIFYKEKKVKCK